MKKSLTEILTITPEALSYLKEKGKQDLIIELPSYRQGGETIALQLPSVHAKKPAEKNMLYYDHVVIDGVNLYVARNLTPPEDGKVVIDVQSILKIRVLEVEGFDLED